MSHSALCCGRGDQAAGGQRGARRASLPQCDIASSLFTCPSPAVPAGPAVHAPTITVERLAVPSEAFVFGSFRLMPTERTLLDGDKPLRVGSRALDILVTLVESAGETVPKDELMARVWPGTNVDEASLRVHIAALRKA